MACEQSRQQFFGLVGISGSAAAVAAFGSAAQAAAALGQIYQTACARQDYGVVEAQAATRLLFAEMRLLGLNPLPHRSTSGLPRARAQQGYTAVLRTLLALRAGTPLPPLAARVQQRIQARAAAAAHETDQASRPQHWKPFQIGEIPADRLVGPMPANHMYQEHVLSHTRLLTVGFENYALEDPDGTMGSTFMLHEGGRLQAYLYVSWDILHVLFDQPGMVVSTDRGDENFSYLATIQPDGSYRIDHWGTQNDATIVLSSEEVAYIRQEISRVVAPPTNLSDLQGVYVRQPEDWEQPDHCRYCQELLEQCSCDCYTCGEDRTSCDCRIKDEREAARLSYQDQRDQHGRRLDSYQRPCRPFDRQGDNTVDRGYVASRAPVVTVRYDRYIFRGQTWREIVLHLAAYQDRAAKDQCDVEVGDVLAVAAIAHPDQPGEHLFTSPNPDFWRRIAWDEHGVTIQDSLPFKHDTGRISLTWHDWSVVLDGVHEFTRWDESGENL